jgi:AcrR family transcriptional regulator
MPRPAPSPAATDETSPPVGADIAFNAGPAPLPPSTKEQLVLTAERLFAVHGIDAVSLRQICVEAGNANNSAVQYHFGDKDRLLQAIFEYRIPHLMVRRNLLAAEAVSRGEFDDVRTALLVQFLPLVEQAELDSSYYLGFVTQLNHSRSDDHPYWRLPPAYRATVERYRIHLHELLSDLPPTLRWFRIQLADTACMQACAAREQARHLGREPNLPYGFHVEALFDALGGILTAPISATAAKAADTLTVENLAPFYPDINPPAASARERKPR